MTMSRVQATMVGIILELLATGAYTLMFLDHMKIMYRQRSTTVPYIYLLCTSITIFVLCWAHTITNCFSMYTGFTGHMDVPNAPIAFFNHNGTWAGWLRTIAFDILTAVSDLFFVFRTWILWDKNYLICAIPFLLFLTDIGTAAYLWWALAHSSNDPAFGALLVAKASRYFFSVTLALTLTCSFLIAYKFWSLQKNIRPVFTSSYSGEYAYSRLSRIATIILESAAIYSTLLVVLIITDIQGVPGFFIPFTMAPPIIGLVFSSIIVRTMKPSEPGSKVGSAPRFRSRQETGEITCSTTSSGGVQIHLAPINQVDSSNCEREFKTSEYNDPAGV